VIFYIFGVVILGYII